MHNQLHCTSFTRLAFAHISVCGKRSFMVSTESSKADSMTLGGFFGEGVLGSDAVECRVF